MSVASPEIPSDRDQRTPHLEDRPGLSLDLSEVWKLTVRTLPYLRPILRELRPLAYVLIPLAIIGLPAGWMGTDLLLNRMLMGNPITPTEATVLFLDPAHYVEVEKLGIPEREVLRNRIVITTLVIGLALIPVGIWIGYRFLMIRQLISQLLRVELVGNVQAQSMRFHSGTKVGDSIYRAYQDSAMVTGMMGMLFRPIGPLWTILSGLVLSVIFDWRFPVALLFLYLALYWFALRTTPNLRLGFRHARERSSALMSRIQETLSGIKVVKAFGAEAVEQERFEAASRHAFAGAFEGRSRLALLGIASYIIAGTIPMAAATYVALLAREGAPLLLGVMVAFVGFSFWNLGAYAAGVGRVSSTAMAGRRLLYMWAHAQDMAIGMERAFGQVDRKPEVENAPDAIPLPPFRDAVTFHGVGFGYRSDRLVLEDVDLVVPAGSITAIVGPTGSGKSTLVSLLLRLFDPDAGRIEIDGRDLRTLEIESLRSQVAIALQENLLFGTTIFENIRYAVPDAGDEAVRAAARIACADEFILDQPSGYDTPLGERGARLSSGQRQRLSIARAIIKDAPILILDEPTAALDAGTELRVMENLSEWGRGRAIFLVTHRLSTIRRADQIVYLHDGRVVESGSPEELMQRPDGAYRRFVELESGGTSQSGGRTEP